MFSAFLLLYAFLDDQQLYPCHSHSIDFMTGYIWLHLISPQRECRFSPKPYGFLFPTWTCSDFHNIHTNDCNPSITEEMISGIGERSTCRDDFCLRVHLMMLVHLGFIITIGGTKIRIEKKWSNFNRWCFHNETRIRVYRRAYSR